MATSKTQDPRFYLLSAAAFDGTTTIAATSWTVSPTRPGATPPPANGQPRMVANVNTAGRVGYAAIHRSGSLGALVSVRCYGTPAGGDVWRIRSVSAAESPSPAPALSDQILYTEAISTEWSAPQYLGPTDALAFEIDLDAGQQSVEIMVLDIHGPEALAWASAKMIECCADTPSSIEFFVENLEDGDPLPNPTAELNFYYVGDAQNGTLLLPDPSVLTIKQQLYISNVEGAQVLGLDPPVGVTINGIANGGGWAALGAGDGVLVRKSSNTRLFGVKLT